MAARLKVKITGKGELFRVLDAMSPKARQRVVKTSLNTIAVNLLRTIRRKFLSGPAPHRLERRTGRTIHSIVIDRSGLGRGYVDVGSLAELWWLSNYELGRGARGSRPFLRPAVQLIIPTIEGVFREQWRREISKA